MDPAGLLAIATAFTLVAAAPGPANLACASVAMARGRGPGLRFAVGLSAGLALCGVLAAAGMGAVLRSSPVALVMLKLVGGAYLLWLALAAARSAMTRDAPGAPVSNRHDDRGGWVLRGLVLNLTNPKAVFAWMAALSVGLAPEAGLAGLSLATALCALLGLANYVLWATVFSTPRARTFHARMRRRVDGAVAGLFTAAGLGLIRSAVARG